MRRNPLEFVVVREQKNLGRDLPVGWRYVHNVYCNYPSNYWHQSIITKYQGSICGKTFIGCLLSRLRPFPPGRTGGFDSLMYRTMYNAEGKCSWLYILLSFQASFNMRFLYPIQESENGAKLNIWPGFKAPNISAESTAVYISSRIEITDCMSFVAG